MKGYDFSENKETLYCKEESTVPRVSSINSNSEIIMQTSQKKYYIRLELRAVFLIRNRIEFKSWIRIEFKS